MRGAPLPRRRKSIFAKFDPAEFEDPSAAYADPAKPRTKPKVSIAPVRSDSLAPGTAPVHKSALPAPPLVARPPRTPQKPLLQSQPSVEATAVPPAPAPAARRGAPTYAGGSVGGAGDTPASLIGPNLSALASQQASLTDSSPFAQSLERKSSGLSRSSAHSVEGGSEPEGPATLHNRSAVRPKQDNGMPDEEVLHELGLSGDSASSSRSNVGLIKKL